MFKKGFLSLVCSLMIMLMIPFSISALSDDLPAPFIGVNIYQDDVEYTGPYGTYWIYKSGDNYRVELQGVRFNTNIPLWHYDFVLDSNYVGDVTVSYTSGSNTISSIYYVNGNHLEINIVGQVTEFTISDVHLNNIGGSHTWLFPVESYSIVQSMFSAGFEMVDMYNSSLWTFPIFLQDNSKYIINYNMTVGNSYYIVFLTSNAVGIYNVDSFNRRFTYNGNLLEFKTLSVSKAGRLVRVHIENNTNATLALELKFADTNSNKFIPIYFGDATWRNISTDFALQFGLSNDFLDAMVYGTDGTNQSASNLDDVTSDLNSTMNDISDLENDFNDDLTNHLNNIDTTTTLPQAMGSNFLSSANWVRVQFNRMTESTPFGSLLGFSLVLGLGLLIIGKVYK